MPSKNGSKPAKPATAPKTTSKTSSTDGGLPIDPRGVKPLKPKP